VATTARAPLTGVSGMTGVSGVRGARVAIVHEWLVSWGGAEVVLRELLALFPGAELYVLLDHFSAEHRAALGLSRPAHTSFLQHVPGIAAHYRSFLPLLPAAARSLDVSRFDLVISNSHSFAKGVRTRTGQRHLCYCLSPTRYAWDLRDQYLRESGLDRGVKGMLAGALLERTRRWDLAAAGGVGAFATLSEFIADRIRRAYGREAQVIYPPVDTEYFTPEAGRGGPDGGRGTPDAGVEFYVTASRFVPYKRVDLIARAFARLGDRTLVIIGDGPDAAKVRAAAGANVTLVGHQTRESVRDHLRRARAFLFAAEEDFGIAPVEALACGTPVIAFGRGGVTETVRGLDDPSPTGVFYAEQSPDALADAIRKFESLSTPISPRACRDRALLFTANRFRTEFRRFVERHA